MMFDRDHCPTASQLEQFVLGELSESELVHVATHTDSCDSCQAALASLDEKQDVLLGRLRRGQEQQAIVTPANSTLEEMPSHSIAVTTISEGEDRLRRLLGRLEELSDRTRSKSTRDWMLWMRAEFGSPATSDGVVRVGDFRIDAVVGVGGMGVVFDAYDERLQRRVALKFMRPEIATTTRVRERFSIEARAMAAVVDAHVVRIFQVGQIGTLPYLTMEFLEGESLAQRLRHGPACQVPEVVQIGAQIAAGLAAAHRCGLIHRDVKPDNVFLTADSVKLLDFGLARSIEGTNFASQLDERDWVLGTPAFMSPEQAQAQPVDERTDLFSLGCVLYRLITGRLPFDGSTPQELLQARVTQSPMSIQVLAPHVPKELTTLIDQMLAKDPQRRPASSSEVARRLTALLPRPPRKIFGRRTLIASAVVASLAAAGAGWQWWESAVRIEPLAPAWLLRVTKLKPAELVPEVVAELRRRNPQWDGQHQWDQRQQAVVWFAFDSQHVRDISPLRAFRELESLYCVDKAKRHTLVDFSPLHGLPLHELDCGSTGMQDLSPLRGMPLRVLRLSATRVSDLRPLANSPLTLLQLSNTLVEDLTPIRDCPLQLVSFWNTRVSDLSPLHNMSTLNRVECERTQVRDLSPLLGLQINYLACEGSPIKDYSILRSLPLEELHLTYSRELHRDLLLGIKSLKKVNYTPVDEVLR